MRAEPELERVVRSWLQEEGHEDAERILFTVLDQVDTTPQRRAGWLARRFPIMNRTNLRYGIGAAAIVLIALLGFNLLPQGDTGEPAASPSASATPPALPDGTLAAGTYVLHPFLPPHHGISVTVTVPDGWEGFNGNGLVPVTGAAGPGGMGIGFNMVSALYSDPCRADAPDWPVGPSVDDLVRAFGAQTAYQTTEPNDVEIDGYSGTKLALLLPSDVDFSSCTGGTFWVWDGPPYAQGPGNRWDLNILDIEGARVVILAQTNPETSTEDRAELQRILDSVRIDAPARSAQPTASQQARVVGDSMPIEPGRAVYRPPWGFGYGSANWIRGDLVLTMPGGWVQQPTSRGGGAQGMRAGSLAVKGGVAGPVWTECEPEPRTAQSTKRSVEEFVSAITSIRELQATQSAVTLGGFAGSVVNVQVPMTASCEYPYGWATGSRAALPSVESFERPWDPGSHHELWVLDVDGVTFVLDASYGPDATAAERDELREIVASAEFELY